MKVFAFALVLGTTVAFAGLPAAQAVSCGAVLGPGGSFTLTSDVGPCTTSNALVIVGPTTVNLAGHTVSCNSSGGGSNAIEIVGSGAVVKNGRATGCVNRGVDVQGSGSHQVRDVLADHNGEGFVIGSGRNTLIDNGAVANDGEGFVVQSSSASNTLVGNSASNNFDSGFDLLGNANTVTSNTAAHNVGIGFLMNASSNSLHGNTAIDNGTDGFYVGGNSNTVSTNQAFGNGHDGVFVHAGATRNFISGNAVLGQGSFDLEDDNAGCDSNTWSGDVFRNHNQACAR